VEVRRIRVSEQRRDGLRRHPGLLEILGGDRHPQIANDFPEAGVLFNEVPA
jgi:hypothetical protein